MALDKTLRDLAARGELTYLSLSPVAGKGGSGNKGNVVFAAIYSPASTFGHGRADDPDPVKAILKAIESVKLPKPKDEDHLDILD